MDDARITLGASIVGCSPLVSVRSGGGVWDGGGGMTIAGTGDEVGVGVDMDVEVWDNGLRLGGWCCDRRRYSCKI